MEQPESETGSIMEPARGLEPFFHTKANFELTRELPEDLSTLDKLSKNFYWSWQPAVANLFREIDPQLWIEYEQNPRALL